MEGLTVRFSQLKDKAGEVVLQPGRDDKPQSSMSDMRIAVLGKTGAGKSSLCNTMSGRDVFKINHTANSETTQCQRISRSVNGRSITLIDTPGFFDTGRPREEMRSEIVRCITECAPGPHAFLIVLKLEKFTEHENQVIARIKQDFSEEALKYAAVVFTHGDQLPEGMKIEEFFRENKGLCDLLEKCGNRYHVIDNKYWKNQQDEYRSNKFQVAELLNTIDKITEQNKGGCYTNEMLQAVERKIQQEEKNIRLSSANMSGEEIRQKAKRNVSDRLKKAAGITTGALLGALLGVPVMISCVVAAVTGVAAAAAVETAVTAGGAVTAGIGLGIGAVFTAVGGAVVGGCIGGDEADQAGSAREAAENTVKAVWDTAKSLVNNKKQQLSVEEQLCLKNK
ncbi:GTPase IMAP family member 7-like [Lates calcarifer]|uniref:GTPase IMAP family member 7-like n=1 Tax=Lates calcarifer TaxID=8187 RepID=A0AAJ8DU36_LATCA|nr:GTPase IMAP family member 7-like [Lates calcarifer]